MDPLNEDFREFIGLLESEEVEYLIVGGYAVAIHGFPRGLAASISLWLLATTGRRSALDTSSQ